MDSGELRSIPEIRSREAEYRAVAGGCGLRRSDSGFVLLAGTGEEPIDFLNRLSTNDMGGLRRGEARSTVFTTEKGRVVDFVTVLGRENGALLVANDAPAVRTWLERYVIMEQLTISDVSAEFGAIELFGPDAGRVAGSLSDLKEGSAHGLPGIAADRYAFPDPLWKGFKHVVIAPRNAEAALREHVVRLAGSPEAPMIRQEILESLRVGRGIPAYGKELLPGEVNPLEAGLIGSISFTKGCYIGQEVIARLDTYKKVQRRLALMALDGSLSELPSFRCTIVDNGSEVGFSTSYAWSYDLRSPLALGYLKCTLKNGPVTLVAPGGVRISAHVTSLPLNASSSCADDAG